MVEDGAADPADAQAAPLEDYNAPEVQPYDPPPPWDTDLFQGPQFQDDELPDDHLHHGDHDDTA
eukprot:3796618-Pyramimonas_sp.AAC.1